MFPMTFCSLEKGEHSASLVWADSSLRVLYVAGDLPISWQGVDATQAVTRLLSAGWKEEVRGKVEDI